MKSYSTVQVSFLSGATLRQLQWWSENGFCRPSMFRGNRQWDRVEMAVAIVLIGIRKKGLSLAQTRSMLPLLRSKLRDGVSSNKGVMVAICPKERDAIVATSHPPMIRFLEKAKGPVTFVKVTL